MSFKNTSVGLLLSLLLGLSTTVSITHSHYYHDRLPSSDDHSQHNHHDGNAHKINFSSYGDLKDYNDHDESNCVFTVLQFSDSSPIQEIPLVSVPICNQNQFVIFIGLQITQPSNGFFARAPPTSV